jgi:hypothetical protein
VIGCNLNGNKEIAVSQRKAGADILLRENSALIDIKLHKLIELESKNICN